MNYSEQSVQKKKQFLEYRKRKVWKRITAYTGLLLGGAVFAFLLTLLFCVFGYVRELIDSVPHISELQIMPEGSVSTIYDAQGNEIQTLVAPEANRMYVSFDQIPDSVQQAFIVIEDARFYEHQGIDFQGILRSVYTDLTQKEQSESQTGTITQQLLKNQVFQESGESSFYSKLTGKLREQWLAVELENSMEKEQILEYYLNTVRLGQNTVGVDMAAKRYFNKSLSELTISEAAVLAAIAADSSEYNPVTNQEKNQKRRAEVLKKLLEYGIITEDEYEDALGDDVYARIQEVNKDQRAEKLPVNTYYVDAVISQVIQDLKSELGYSETQAYNAVYHQGLQIYTCQNRSLQEICDRIVNDKKYYPKGTKLYLSYTLTVKTALGDSKRYTESDLQEYFQSRRAHTEFSLYFDEKKDAGKYVRKFRRAMLSGENELVSETVQYIKQPQISFVLMEQKTGKIRAIVGGRGKKTANRTLNRAISLKRQPGQCFKVLSTFLPALDTCGMTLASVQDDAPYEYVDTGVQVSNWNKTGYAGLTTLRDAVTGQMNIATVKFMEEVTPQTGYDYLKNMGISTLVDNRVGESGEIDTDIQEKLALGELTDGVTNLELTAAYASIAEGGIYREPVFYSKILDKDGNVLLEKKLGGSRVMKSSTAWLLTSAMEGAVKFGVSLEADFKDSEMSVTGIEGFTQDCTDYWFEGYTPYYTAGIWVGYDKEVSQKQMTRQKEMWRDIMERIHKKEKKKEKGFSVPTDVVTCQICSKSGMLAVDGLCDEAEGGSCVRTEYFEKGTEPLKGCTSHIRYIFDKRTGELADENTPPEQKKDRVLLKKDESGYMEETADTPYLAP